MMHEINLMQKYNFSSYDITRLCFLSKVRFSIMYETIFNEEGRGNSFPARTHKRINFRVFFKKAIHVFHC